MPIFISYFIQILIFLNIFQCNASYRVCLRSRCNFILNINNCITYDGSIEQKISVYINIYISRYASEQYIPEIQRALKHTRFLKRVREAG